MAADPGARQRNAVARTRCAHPQAQRWRGSRPTVSSCCATKSTSWKNGRCRPPNWPNWRPATSAWPMPGAWPKAAAGVVELLDGDSEFALRRALGRAHAELGKLRRSSTTRWRPPWSCSTTRASSWARPPTALGRYAQDVDLDPERFDEVDNHLARLHELSRRHRLPVAELHDKLAELRSELAELEGAGDALDQLGGTTRSALQLAYGEAAPAIEPCPRRSGQSPGQRGQRTDGGTGHGGRCIAASNWSRSTDERTGSAGPGAVRTPGQRQPGPAATRRCARSPPAVNWRASAWRSKSPRWARTPSAA